MNAGGSSVPGKRISHGQGKPDRLNSTSRMAATVTVGGRGCMASVLLLAWGGMSAPARLACHLDDDRKQRSCQGVPLFTHLPRVGIPDGNPPFYSPMAHRAGSRNGASTP